ncbi:uncharacterized protein HMPREF1541_02519 [Cyphellophora europaea CBS 101466]|uniref:RRM domain-containing protein n=1 Tax=Cyphellophora europaea (strain CBS 101466) TaxID=1220924 RepID=W2S444_CYPE1|nr:uncharacterized protein HMPREF1541_02519 [Cyphellophora europaea CBS 101466]ETN43360.1 hypothetical protein HMPREF1541_02519 [Cyphellophora europaea CBS 101466]
MGLRASPSDDVFRTPRRVDTPIPGEVAIRYSSPPRFMISATSEVEHQPRLDRGTEIDPSNAQGKLPPDAAIFAANLIDEMADDQLQHALHQAFDIFGKCYIQVKRDRSGHPFAIIQYETVASASQALRDGCKTIINGREVRLEKARVDRAVIITHLSRGSPVLEPEARNLLSQFGEIELIVSTDLIRGRPNSLLKGQYVRFVYWLDCRDALRGFHHITDQYRLQLATGVEPRSRITSENGTTIVTGLGRARTNIDAKSIFVGALPEDVSKTEVFDTFSQFGEIFELNIVRKRYEGSMNCFSFIEFNTPFEADNAITSDVWIRGQKLRIEPKEYSTRRGHRNPQGYPPYQSRNYQPRPRQPDPSYAQSPARISPAANAALQERLAQNNLANNTIVGSYGNRAPNIYTPPHLRGNGPNPYSPGDRFTPQSYRTGSISYPTSPTPRSGPAYEASGQMGEFSYGHGRNPYGTPDKSGGA